MRNRDILFKGKRVDNNEWEIGYFYHNVEYNKSFIINDSESTEVHPDTVCHFVKDDLFVDDIVERPENHKCTGEDLSIGKYQVVYDSYNLRYALKTIKSEIFKEGSIVNFHGILTKTGNIHD